MAHGQQRARNCVRHLSTPRRALHLPARIEKLAVCVCVRVRVCVCVCVCVQGIALHLKALVEKRAVVCGSVKRDLRTRQNKPASKTQEPYGGMF